MTVCVIPGVLKKSQPDKMLVTLEWPEILNTGIGRTMPVVDRIASSTWAIAANSPSSNVILQDSGFDEVSGTTWVAVDAGFDGDVVYIENTIETTGASVNGKSTPPQRAVRQIRMRIQQC
ncbi:hypothetical protein [Sulfitobacter sp. 1A15106]|uniref:hypothetical protein n=1 Tax=Sulfitobacter sp. 1A15106 TaxID=3368590 RepID=UPI0037469A9C